MSSPVTPRTLRNGATDSAGTPGLRHAPETSVNQKGQNTGTRKVATTKKSSSNGSPSFQ
jgi:hypothetical protein